MNNRRTCSTKAWALTTMLLGVWLCPAQAAQGGGQFNVNVTLQSTNSPTVPKTGTCHSSSLLNVGSAVTLVCSSDTLTDNRYVLQSTRTGEFIGFSESEAGSGNVASWRIIQLANREYLEMLIGW